MKDLILNLRQALRSRFQKQFQPTQTVPITLVPIHPIHTDQELQQAQELNEELDRLFAATSIQKEDHHNLTPRHHERLQLLKLKQKQLQSP